MRYRENSMHIRELETMNPGMQMNRLILGAGKSLAQEPTASLDLLCLVPEPRILTRMTSFLHNKLRAVC